MNTYIIQRFHISMLLLLADIDVWLFTVDIYIRMWWQGCNGIVCFIERHINNITTVMKLQTHSNRFETNIIIQYNAYTSIHSKLVGGPDPSPNQTFTYDLITWKFIYGLSGNSTISIIYYHPHRCDFLGGTPRIFTCCWPTMWNAYSICVGRWDTLLIKRMEHFFSECSWMYVGTAYCLSWKHC